MFLSTEEKELIERFGAPYKKYMKEVPALLVRPRNFGKLMRFILGKKGSISNVKLTDTSGYPSVDEELIKIITNMPEKWEPAENSNGEKVNQEFVFFFGTQGC